MAFSSVSHLFYKIQVSRTVVQQRNLCVSEIHFSLRGSFLHKFYHKNAFHSKAEESRKNEKRIDGASHFQLEGIPFDMEDHNQKSSGGTSKLLVKQQVQHQHQHQGLNDEKFNPPKFKKLKNSLTSIIGLIEEVTHMDDIRKAQANVMNLKVKTFYLHQISYSFKIAC